jgi:predicted glycogen debranching enzyme
MSNLVRSLDWPGRGGEEAQQDREWIVTNGLGGYASGTVSGALTRRFHGPLVAALPSPFGRWMMLNALTECVYIGDRSVPLLEHPDMLREFRVESGLPVWLYEIEGLQIEKRLFLPYGQNTTCILYKLIAGGPRSVRLDLRPAVNFRAHEGVLKHLEDEPYRVQVDADRYEFSSANAELPPLRMWVDGEESAFTFDRRYTSELLYYTEDSRGYEARGSMWSPGYFHLELSTANRPQSSHRPSVGR